MVLWTELELRAENWQIYVVCLELYVCKVRHLDICLFRFERDMSERVHFKYYIFIFYSTLH